MVKFFELLLGRDGLLFKIWQPLDNEGWSGEVPWGNKKPKRKFLQPPPFC